MFRNWWIYNFYGEKNLKYVFSNDFCKNSQYIYNLNFPENPFEFGDLTKIDSNTIPEHDILCAGFPCQPFSIAGKQLGFKDSRSNVFYKILEILNKKAPSVFILENVKNIQSHNEGKTWIFIKKRLTKLNYFIKFTILDTSKYTGIPQHRERLF
jgi:DNA (cytosine-5)-methyltransferase 1